MDIKYIAHYTSIETALAKIFPMQSLKLSDPCNTNDPYERHFDWHAGRLAFGHPKKAVSKTLKSNSETREKIKKSIRIGCFCTNKSIKHRIAAAANNTCLWNYYANGMNGLDSGCCIIFNRNQLIENAKGDGYKIIFDGPIEYFDGEDNGNRPDKSSVDPKNIFSKKEQQWAPEEEYRIICEGDASKIENFGYINTQKSIVGLVLPEFVLKKLDETYLKKLPSICKTKLNIYRRPYSSTSHQCKILPV